MVSLYSLHPQKKNNLGGDGTPPRLIFGGTEGVVINSVDEGSFSSCFNNIIDRYGVC